jgi:hypothetical protein
VIERLEEISGIKEEEDEKGPEGKTTSKLPAKEKGNDKVKKKKKIIFFILFFFFLFYFF